MVQTSQPPGLNLDLDGLRMPDQDAALHEMARVLKPAGRLHTSSAATIGTLGITFPARKAASDEAWPSALAALSCGVTRPG